ncbi:hypothetical protein [Enterobacter kobei]|uniref:hypothetical protein n=1 Tax=Enterobacter kobei TaxID=208224 RepID=UPI00235FF7DC|nr:hypothetical protein [Enterobacter kobei]
MRWRKIIALVTGILVGLCIAYASHTKNSNPNYVQEAIARVGSYLAKDNGPSECKGIATNEKKWKLTCIVLGEGRSYEFSVLPAELAPYPVARSFYLKADNENAQEAAKQGLMQYLQIDIDL